MPTANEVKGKAVNISKHRSVILAKLPDGTMVIQFTRPSRHTLDEEQAAVLAGTEKDGKEFMTKITISNKALRGLKSLLDDYFSSGEKWPH